MALRGNRATAVAASEPQDVLKRVRGMQPMRWGIKALLSQTIIPVRCLSRASCMPGGDPKGVMPSW